MHADARKLLWDARQAGERAARFTHGKTFAEYQADEFLRSAVERQLEIVGEGPQPAPTYRCGDRRSDSGTAPHRRLSQLLIHGYASVDNRIVWGIIEANLGPLRKSLETILAQA